MNLYERITINKSQASLAVIWYLFSLTESHPGYLITYRPKIFLGSFGSDDFLDFSFLITLTDLKTTS
jgi:hypothetical protein